MSTTQDSTSNNPQDRKDRQGTNGGDEGNLALGAEQYRNRAGIDVGHVDETDNQKNVDAGVEHLGVNGPDGDAAGVTTNEQRQRDELEAEREEREKAAKEHAENQKDVKTAADYEAEADKDETTTAQPTGEQKPASGRSKKS